MSEHYNNFHTLVQRNLSLVVKRCKCLSIFCIVRLTLSSSSLFSGANVRDVAGGSKMETETQAAEVLTPRRSSRKRRLAVTTDSSSSDDQLAVGAAGPVAKRRLAFDSGPGGPVTPAKVDTDSPSAYTFDPSSFSTPTTRVNRDVAAVEVVTDVLRQVVQGSVTSEPKQGGGDSAVAAEERQSGNVQGGSKQEQEASSGNESVVAVSADDEENFISTLRQHYEADR